MGVVFVKEKSMNWISTKRRIGVVSVLAVALAGWTGNPLKAEPMELEVELSSPWLLATQPNHAFLKVSLTGAELANPASRPPINVAIVLDKSASMEGENMVRAQEAAKQAIDQLGVQDVACLVAYDSSVRVLVPATRLIDKGAFKAQIDAMIPGGKTALFAGVSKGAYEVRKFLEEGRVNRVVLLSDGKANVGPRTPGDLGEFGIHVQIHAWLVNSIIQLCVYVDK